MLKNVLVLCILLYLILFQGCSSVGLQNPSIATPNKEDTSAKYSSSVSNKIVSEKDNDTSSELSLNETVVLESTLYEKIEESLEVKIKYPQIKSNRDVLIEKINDIIKEAAINKYYEQWDIKGLILDQSYSVEKQDSGLLSIVFSGYAYVAGTAHSTDICHAVTIDLKSAKILTLSDFIESYEYLENKINEKEYEVLSGGLKMLSSEEILNIININFNKKMKYNKNKYYIDKNGKICIIFDLPHLGGDYSVICI